MAEQVYLGVDIGAENGRVMAGLWDGQRVRVAELHRFPNQPVTLGTTLRGPPRKRCDPNASSKSISPTKAGWTAPTAC